MKKILITGCNGLLGQKLVELLAKNNDIQLVATSRTANKIIGVENYEFTSLDITNSVEIDYILDRYLPEIIINAAAMTQVDDCEENKTLCWDINVNGVENLAKKAKKIGAYFMHISSDFVFDGSYGNYKESDAPNPVSYYGHSKLESEKTALSYSTDSAVVRTILMYGVVKSMTRSNIVLWVKNNLEAGKAIRVVNDQYRMPTLAEDLAQACFDIASEKETGIFHISGNEMMSVYEIALKVALFFNLDKSLINPVASIELKEKAKRPPKTGFDLHKAYTKINYRPHSFLNGLEVLKKQLK